jgi:hypothetical protein
MKPNGAILWSGASLIDGAPIVAIAVGLANDSSNRKTGAMLQTYILRSDTDPNNAVRMGADASICGDCPHRGHLARRDDGSLRNAGRTCYVNVGQGPLGVYRAYTRGRYADIGGNTLQPDALEQLGAGRIVRLGTYGDPAAVPAEVWHALTARSAGRTGYTHQWRKPFARGLRSLCMASADSEADASLAHAMGWRTFRVVMPGDLARMPVEAVCPASAEAGKKLTCTQCLACGGSATGRRGSIVIAAHGGFGVLAAISKRSKTNAATIG